MKRSLVRALVGAAAGGVLVVALVSPAAAHVTVDPSEAAQGSYSRVVFRMPTESDTSSTTQLEVFFPEDTPIPTVTVLPVPGWDVEVDQAELDEPIETGHGAVVTRAVTSITWTAQDEDAGLAPGEFGEFPVLMGPLPEVDEVAFRALQTYSDDVIVRWIELPEPDGEEPAFPAPILTLVEGQGDGHGHGEAAPETDPAAADDTGTTGVWLGLAGLLAGLAGMALGGVALARSRPRR